MLSVQRSIFIYSVLDQLQVPTLKKWLNYAHTVKPVLNKTWVQRNRVFSGNVFQSRGSLTSSSSKPANNGKYIRSVDVPLLAGFNLPHKINFDCLNLNYPCTYRTGFRRTSHYPNILCKTKYWLE